MCLTWIRSFLSPSPASIRLLLWLGFPLGLRKTNNSKANHRWQSDRETNEIRKSDLRVPHNSVPLPSLSPDTRVLRASSPYQTTPLRPRLQPERLGLSNTKGTGFPPVPSPPSLSRQALPTSCILLHLAPDWIVCGRCSLTPSSQGIFEAELPQNPPPPHPEYLRRV